MARVKCGNCGAYVELPEKSSFGMGFNISKESVGNYTLKMEKENKNMTRAEERIATLKANGVDTSNYFAINEDTVIKMNNGVPELVPIVKQIVNDGDVFNGKLDGRWIMAQMFYMLQYENRYHGGKGYNDALNNKGYMYQWNMLVGNNHGKESGELIRLAHRERDGEDMGIKAIWFNNDLIVKMIDDYIDSLQRYISSLPTYMCKKVLPYKRLGGRYSRLTGKPNGDIFVEDLNELYAIYKKYAYRAKYAKSYRDLYRIVAELRKDLILPYDWTVRDKYFKMSQVFKDAYKGNGAYYTAANLIRFHGCRVGSATKEESLKILNRRAVEGCGWKLLGFLKELIDENDFDFKARMRELSIN